MAINDGHVSSKEFQRVAYEEQEQIQAILDKGKKEGRE